MPDFDAQQQEAVSHTGSVVLRAGAGSGKTRVLVARYGGCLDRGAAIANLAAITFTHKSTREMRDRIRDAITANPAWSHHEPHLETAVIDTIHGFCTAILRAHASAAGLKPDFAVIEGSNATALRYDAATSALQTILLEPADDLRELVVIFGWKRVVEAVEKFLESPDTAAWRSFAARSPEEIAAGWLAAANRFVPGFVANALDTTPQLAALRTVAANTGEGRRTLKSVLGELDRLRTEPSGVDLEALLEAARVGSQSAGLKRYGALNYGVVRDGFEAVRDLIRDIGILTATPDRLTPSADVSLRMTRVVLKADAAYTRRKRAENVVDFNDLLVLTRDLLRANGPAREALQSQYRYLLLDELQDTDPIQMEIVESLLGERLATGLFAVGDAKQSIYRFRGAEVSLFERLRERVPEDSRLSLVKNYRSVPGILRFVNALCSVWFPSEEPLTIVRGETDPRPVEFLWVLSDGESADDLRAAEAAAIADRIKSLTAGPDGVPPGDIVLLFRALTNSAIYERALEREGIDYYLVGGRAYFAQQEVYDIANVLKAIENPRDHLSVAGVLRSPIVGLSDDAVTALCTSDDGPWAALQVDVATVPQSERGTAGRAARNLSEWRRVKDSLPVARLLQKIIAESEYDAALLLEPLGERKLANLWKLQAIARDHRRTGLAEFAQLLVDQIARQPREEQAATVPEKARTIVRLMTIHQAKGLEFPVVIVPDLDAETGSNFAPAARWHRDLGTIVTIPSEDSEDELGYSKWPYELGNAIDKAAEESEALRVLYVACTRAEDRLILSSGLPDATPLKTSGAAMLAISKVFDLESGIGPGVTVPVNIVRQSPSTS